MLKSAIPVLDRIVVLRIGSQSLSSRTLHSIALWQILSLVIVKIKYLVALSASCPSPQGASECPKIA